MRRWTAVALVLPFLGLGALFANAGGRRWVRELAAEQVEDVLDAIAVTAAQRAALDEFKEALAVRLESKMAQLGTMIRTVWHFGASDCPLHRRYQVIALPGNEPIWIERSVDIEFHSAPPTPLRSCHSVAQLAVPRFLPSLISAPPPPRKTKDCHSWQSRRSTYRASVACDALDCSRDSRSADRG